MIITDNDYCKIQIDSPPISKDIIDDMGVIQLHHTSKMQALAACTIRRS